MLKVGVVESESENWGKKSMVSSATKRCIRDGAPRPICPCIVVEAFVPMYLHFLGQQSFEGDLGGKGS